MAIVSLLICSPPRGRPCRLPTDPAALDAVVCGLVEPDERMAVRVGDERGHTGPAVGPGKGHAIDVGFPDGGEGADRLRDLRGRDVLALPAERVADTVDEIEVAVRVPSHEVTGAKPRVARLEDAAQDLALGVFLARVPLESPARVRRLLEHLADRLADL